ncbi:bifunctional glutathionylspermidine amidase/synthase [Pseudoalteromonas sp. SG45-5]|uniref:bifunctional glutathionylspermidine amidase/synthase n=1 Tax=unclassified Pseudoalteromonas TaxID=194690 RepID=UPI0015FD9273|nr:MULTISPECIES: bifunctional glutathionylspermidine amidase/synthase [unclassified Pseudoalteromonas]MBB1387048.1 bifunctional glutathionylspermidine amidase/synthase [Pseudoalteromonas sp. SG45-5]MBB1395143.1 bifunctional glutathionylspermidine amidase/synthase [Pseudoalteromonas sp. SG44-4]MBB1449347.1 bifunctional glutathionylspermidine amidase/synthase [Pseudoalteromonas sp. SG41-6]
MKTFAPASVFGTLLGYAPGNVAVYSSDYDTADESTYPNRSAYRSYLDGIYMGYKWQCVEFARRWMYLNHGYIFDDIAMAYDIFELRSVRDVSSQNRLPLNAFKNGAKNHPQVGSLLIWEEGGEFEETGHVAVVVEVHEDKIRLAEQNVGHQIWPKDQSWCRELKAKVTKDGDYWIECSYSDATILGWMTQTDKTEYAEPTSELNKDLFTIEAHKAADTGQANKSWLNIANDDEAAYVDMMQGHKLTSVDEDQHNYFAISQTAQQIIEHATNELHGLFMHATDYVLQHPELLEKFNLPDVVLSKIRQSWDNRLNQLITSRFDFALTTAGLKVYEYNCDSASCYMESGKIQGKWGKHFGVKTGVDAGQSLFKDLVKAWRKSEVKGLVHILQDDEPEEHYHALFMKEAIEAAGFECKLVIGLSTLRWNESGNIVDADGAQLSYVWKTWSWETALDQIREECEADQSLADDFEPQLQAGETPRLADVLLRKNVMVFEPLWTLIPSNKAILPILWSLFPNHKYLLNTAFELNEELLQSGYVVKPIVGRCGANIQLVDEQQQIIEKTVGHFASQDQIYQQLFALPKVDDYFVQICSFTAAGKYSGGGVRVDKSMIINGHSDCMALRIK